MDENLSNMPANYGDDEGHASSGNSLKDVPGRATAADGLFEANVRGELQRVVSSPHFEASERNHRFLTYVVEETLAGRSARLKAYSIATVVYGRPDSFDPALDPIVRMEAGKVRRALTRFYLTEGVGSAGVRIRIPTGGYVAEFDTISPHDLVAYPADEKRTLPISVQLFGAEGDLSALNNLNQGVTLQIIIGLHLRGCPVVCGPEIGRWQSSREDHDRTNVSVGYVLTGSMGVFDDALSVIAVLQDCSTGRVLWGQNFRRQIPSGLLLTARDEIADDIAGSLHDFLAE